MKIKEDEIPALIRLGKDREVIPLLYKKVLPLVENYITRRSGRKEDAYDVFQDAMMLFYKQIIKDTFNSKYKVFGYLYRMSLNLWINKIKKDKRVDFVEEIQDLEGEEVLTLNESLIAGNDDDLLKTLFSPIGEKCIELLTYTIYNNMLMEDIAIRMGFTSVSAVKMQQLRCKQKLMKEIEKNPLLEERLKSK